MDDDLNEGKAEDGPEVERLNIVESLNMKY